MENILAQAKFLQSDLVSWRRHLHQNPELGMVLPLTSAFVSEKLKEMGYSPQSMAGSGIVATVGGKNPGKCFLLRADMDALPINEESGIEFSSQNSNMHACGHDFHIAMLLGAAKLLKQNENMINGTVKLMFQPGEEVMKGGKAMVDEGVLENPKVDAASMIHVMSGLSFPSGSVMIPSAGAFSSSSDIFEITIQGKGGHGAMPNATIDPINVACHLHLALQALNSREVSPDETVVVTIGCIQSGETANVIPDTAVIKGTVRTFNEDVRQFILSRIPKIAHHTAEAFRASADVNIITGCDSVVVDESVSDNIRASLSEVLGENVIDKSFLKNFKMSASEDFAYIASDVPSVLIGLSTGSPTEGYPYYMHHPKVTFNEDVLYEGAAIHAISALGWLNANK